MNPTDHTDDALPTLDEYLTARGWTRIRVEKENGNPVGIYSKNGASYRAGDALRVEWDEQREATK